MENNTTRMEQLIEVLYYGILEIRLLSSGGAVQSSGGAVQSRRINKMTNILHNIPRSLQNPELFDVDMLKKELNAYQSTYKDGLDLVRFLE